MIRTTRGDFNGCGAYAVRRALVRQYLNSRARVKNKPSEQTSSQVFRRASPEIYRLKSSQVQELPRDKTKIMRPGCLCTAPSDPRICSVFERCEIK